MNKRKVVALMGGAFIVGVALWMRELASWRPVLVGKAGFGLFSIEMARDGKTLHVDGDEQKATLDLETGQSNTQAKDIQNSGKDCGPQDSPCVSIKRAKNQLVFRPTPSRTVVLPIEIDLFYANREDFYFAWSKDRQEVYCEMGAQIWVWDWNNGKLKRKTRCFYSGMAPVYACFSPDARSVLIASENTALDRYETKTGRKIISIVPDAIYPNFPLIGFSPDGRLIWFVRQNDLGVMRGLEVRRASDNKVLWTAPCGGIVKWLPDGRIGLAQKNGFEWRTPSGRLINRLSGPFENVTDWTTSPDGDWLYVANDDGAVYRYRAR